MEAGDAGKVGEGVLLRLLTAKQRSDAGLRCRSIWQVQPPLKPKFRRRLPPGGALGRRLREGLVGGELRTNALPAGRLSELKRRLNARRRLPNDRAGATAARRLLLAAPPELQREGLDAERRSLRRRAEASRAAERQQAFKLRLGRLGVVQRCAEDDLRDVRGPPRQAAKDSDALRLRHPLQLPHMHTPRHGRLPRCRRGSGPWQPPQVLKLRLLIQLPVAWPRNKPPAARGIRFQRHTVEARAILAVVGLPEAALCQRCCKAVLRGRRQAQGIRRALRRPGHAVPLHAQLPNTHT